MDYENYKIHKVREIHCLEDTPANLKLSNDNKNRYGDPNFFQFYFNFTNFIGYNPNNLTINNNKNNNQNNSNEEIFYDIPDDGSDYPSTISLPDSNQNNQNKTPPNNSFGNKQNIEKND